MALRDQPYFKMYAKDFLSDEKLRMCSPESVGVYIMTMCYLHRTPKYGALSLAEWQKESDDNIENFAKVLLRQLPFSLEEIERGIRQLVREGALTVEGDTLFQKRMVKDGEISETRAASGALGGEKKNKSIARAKQKHSKSQANNIAKPEQNPEYEHEHEYEHEYESVSNNSFGKVMSYYMDHINATPSELTISLLRDYAVALGSDVTIHAMQIALDERKTAWSYINAILRRYEKDGLTTMDAVLQSEQSHRAKKDSATSRTATRTAKAPSEYTGRDFLDDE